MKKVSIHKGVIIAVILIMLLGLQHMVYAERPIRIIVGGEYVETDIYPIVINDRVLLPVRTLFEAIGADVLYIPEEQKVVANKNGNTVEFEIGSNVIVINGNEKEMDVPATEINSRTFAPIRACAEAFSLNVEWNDKTKIVKVLKPCSLVVEEKSRYDKFARYQYDEWGNCILEHTTENGVEDITEYTYDENGNVVLVKYPDSNNGWIYEYNDYGEEIFSRTWEGTPSAPFGSYWSKHDYDDNGRLIYYEVSNLLTGASYLSTIIYDEDGTKYEEGSDGFKDITKYWVDNRVKVIYSEEPDGTWYKENYDENGRQISWETSDGFWEKYIYDEKGNLVLEENSTGDQVQYKYTYNENGKLTLVEIVNKYHSDSTNRLYKEYKYDDKGNMVYLEKGHCYPEGIIILPNGGYRHYKGEDTDAEVVYRTSDEWTKYTYDENNNLIYEEGSKGEYKKYIVIVK